MSIVIGNRQYRVPDLSEHARLVLSWIDGGFRWFEWAAQNAGSRHHFEDERAMVGAVLSALHDSRFLFLPRIGLLVGPAKLMSLSLADLRLLAIAEASDEPGAHMGGIRRIATAEHLFFASDFDAADAMLDAMQVASAPLFRTRSLMDQVALAQLRLDPVSASPLAGEAAAFAVARARTVRTFLDHFRIYLDLALTVPGERRAETADAAIESLLQPSFAALGGPRVEGLAGPGQAKAAIATWLMSGRPVGFARASLAIQQLVGSGHYSGDTGQQAAARMNQYLGRAQALLAETELSFSHLAQDGMTVFCRVDAQSDVADLEVSPEGIMTLIRYRRTD
ncbi:hypothetical protein ACG3SL_11230 [Sphingomonas sp. CJ20]